MTPRPQDRDTAAQDRDPDLESVLRQMADDYAKGNLTLEQFEEYVENRLRGMTPMRSDGFPIYYEDGLLNGTILNQLA